MTFLLAVALTAPGFAGWVPARWGSGDAASLELLRDTPVNCLLLEPEHWSSAFAQEARSRKIDTLGVIRVGGGGPVAAVRQALAAKLTGVALEGEFPSTDVQAVREVAATAQAAVIEILPRRLLRPGETKDLLATYQGVWPGIPVQPGGAAKAGPTGSPWVNTNMGFLLFARAATDAPVWIANPPPQGEVLKADNYLQAICDAAVLGARWVLDFDADFRRRLLERDPATLAGWKRIAAHLRYFEEHPEWRNLRPYRGISVIQDADSGALVSGGILDMIAVKHTPLQVVPRRRLHGDALRGSRMVLNLEPALLGPVHKEALSSFTGLTLTAPPEVKLPALHGDEITVNEADVKEIDFMWRGISWTITQQNLGAKLYHAAGMLSRLVADQDGKRVVLHLINYTNYPVENVTVRFPTTFRTARLLTPEGGAPKDLDVYEVDQVTAVDLDQVGVYATVLVE